MILKNKKLVINHELAKTFINTIAKNSFFCPCQILQTKDNLCICKQVRDGGKCCCNLYEWVDEK